MRERVYAFAAAVHACDVGDFGEEFLAAVVLRWRGRKDLGA
jgi:hypothetical protein